MAKLFEGAFHHIQKEKRLVGEWFDMPIRDALARMCLYIEVALRSATEDEDLIQEAREASGIVRAVQLLGAANQEDRGAQQ